MSSEQVEMYFRVEPAGFLPDDLDREREWTESEKGLLPRQLKHEVAIKTGERESGWSRFVLIIGTAAQHMWSKKMSNRYQGDVQRRLDVEVYRGLSWRAKLERSHVSCIENNRQDEITKE